jgi:predicted nucleic acid-binding Zn ribbon protein
MQKEPEKLQGILERIIKGKGWEKRLKEAALLTSWEKLFSPPVSTVAKPLKIESGRLFLQVKEAAWKNELSFQKLEILKKLNSFSGSEIVKEIRFVS